MLNLLGCSKENFKKLLQKMNYNIIEKKDEIFFRYNPNTKFKKLQLIPQSIITKDPSAELKFNQKDTDSLPCYQILDKILEYLIDKNYNIKKIKRFGFKEVMIKKIWKMVKNSEFKRYQSAIGPKVSSMSFDKDRRFPITNKFSI